MNKINPQERISLMDLIDMLKELLPFWPIFEAMLTGGGPFEPAPAPADSVDKSNEVVVRELTIKEKALYTGICTARERRLIRSFAKIFWRTIWSNLDIKCPNGIAIRDGYKVVHLLTGAESRTWFSKSNHEEDPWYPTMSRGELEVIHDLAISMRARTDAKASIDDPPSLEKAQAFSFLRTDGSEE